ncbi:uncharacterized protein LOC113325306 [Papaver somniferum]|uniref:uncharacterized protein LOC113325306 n=1 Tax=Papaver somniferum TaxID=3469 RepID=UPI000E6FD419|nr:uncharacterized protein LOC113325306 [Papaver somniferum]
MAGDKKTVHPAFAINNIKTLIPIILDIKQDEYSSWVFLFELHLQAHRLIFIINGDKPPPDVGADTVLQLDVLCRQWMFSTMAKDLMLTVLKSGKTAKEIWNHLKKLFQDNKGNALRLLNLKSLSDRLLDLDFPMDDKRLVIQLVNGLPEEYNTVASFIQQSMPTFDAARSQMRTEEIRRSQQQSQSAPTALAAAAPPSDRSNQCSQRGGHARRGGHRSFAPSTEPPLLPTPPYPYQLYGAPHPTYNIHCPPQWAVPPCPYPTTPPETPWQPPPSRGSFHGRGRNGQSRGRTSGVGRAQAYLTPSTEYLQPSDIAEAYISMSLYSPDDAF